MTDFGWTRLAYLLVVLSVLAALARLGSPSATPRPLAAEPPDKRSITDVPPAATKVSHEHYTPQPGAETGENPQAPTFARHLKRALAGGASGLPDAGKAVFYRPPPANPAAAQPGSGGTPSSGPLCGDLGRFPVGHRLVFPLPRGYASSYEDTWGAPRPQGGHEGTDLMAPTRTPEYAITDGTIVPVTGSNGNGWNTLGGYAVMLRAAYSVGPVREGDLFYYAHLHKESALPLGATVRAGQVVGYAGDTGQGPEVTRGLFPPHLHFGWYDATGSRSYLPSGAMNPYPLLEWITAGGGVLGGGSEASYCEVPRSGPPIPSTGEDRWPAARDAGARPDLDTGSKRPSPSPLARNAAGAPERQSAHTKKAIPTKPRERRPGKHPQTASQKPRSESDEIPGKPAESEPSPPNAPPVGHDPQDGIHAPNSAPESEPAEAEGSERPGEGQEPDGGEEGNGGDEVANDPGAREGKPEGQNPEAEKPREDTPPSDEAAAPDEPSSEAGTDEQPESTTPETEGSEDEAGEELETTTAQPETTALQ